MLLIMLIFILTRYELWRRFYRLLPCLTSFGAVAQPNHVLKCMCGALNFKPILENFHKMISIIHNLNSFACDNNVPVLYIIILYCVSNR